MGCVLIVLLSLLSCTLQDDDVSKNCSDNEFACTNGNCIPIEQRCNRVVNCYDNSDELDCGDIFDTGNADVYDEDPIKNKHAAIGIGTVFALFVIIGLIMLCVKKINDNEFAGDSKMRKERPKSFRMYFKFPGKYRHLMSVRREETDDDEYSQGSRSASFSSQRSFCNSEQWSKPGQSNAQSIPRDRHSIRSNEPLSPDEHCTAV